MMNDSKSPVHDETELTVKTSLIEIFTVFAGISSFTLGGGLAMIPLLQHEIVENKNWLDKNEFIDITGVSQSLPGTFVGNLATAIGMRLRGFPGSLAAICGVTIIPFFVILMVAAFFTQVRHNPYVAKFFLGVRPGIIALLVLSSLKMARSMRMNMKKWIIALLTAGVVFSGFGVINTVMTAVVINILILFIDMKKRKKNDTA